MSQNKPNQDDLLRRWKLRKKLDSDQDLNDKEATDDSHFPLSYEQRGVWYLQKLNPDKAFYNYAELYKVKGNLDPEILEKCLDYLVRNHESLRTIFIEAEGKVDASILPEVKVNIEQFDLSNEETEKIETALKIAKDSARYKFELNKGPLVRTTLIKLDEQDYWFLINIHHLIFDKWSMSILRDELAETYRSLSGGHPKEDRPEYLTYKKYATDQINARINEKSLDYWKNVLNGPIPDLQLPYDYQRFGAPSYTGKVISHPLSNDLTGKIKLLAQRLETTPFVIMLSAYYILLFKYSGQKDILIGAPFTNRSRSELEGTIGFFDGTLVLRNKLENEYTFEKVVHDVKQTVLDSFAHNDIPFELLVKKLNPFRRYGNNNYFQAMFIFHDVASSPPLGDQISFEHEPFDFGVAKFDLTVFIANYGDRMELVSEYADDLFKEETVMRILINMGVLLEHITGNPSALIEELNVISRTESESILTHFDNVVDFDFNAKNILHLFKGQVSTNGVHKALVFKNKTLTYQELDSWSDKVAKFILTEFNQSNVIGLSTSRSLEMIVGIFGILKAGKAYLPLDIAYPAERLKYMLEDAGVQVVLSNIDHEKTHFNASTTVVTFEEINGMKLSGTGIQNSVDPHDLAYIMYTSGSTGKPKGVMITHENLAYSTLSRSLYYNDIPKKFLLMSSYSFDSSVAGIFWTLTSGGTLVLGEQNFEKDLSLIANELRVNQITHTLILPSLYKIMLENLADIDMHSIKCVIVAGEQCASSVRSAHFQKLTSCDLYNEYGPTEGTVWSTVHQLRKGEVGLVSIGRPIPGTKAIILDQNEKLVPMGVEGELYIGGPGISPGYIGNADLTDQKFSIIVGLHSSKQKMYRTGDRARYLHDGQIQFLGRKDQQIKIRGHRIETDEINESLIGHERVTDAATIMVAEYPEPATNPQNSPGIEELAKRMVETLESSEINRILSDVETMHESEIDALLSEN